MRLKSIELNGFKTFATKTNFEFAEEITVIVGPNGSGKSNIADAVRWVLGEQSYKLLRGKKTLDMIFSGSEQRPRAGMASATITFDNSDGWLPIDFSEVTITRRAFRDGKNEYQLNGQTVLLREIYELLGQSGLAERTYTIIGQGLVDAALSLKAEERRLLFEEAAGIGLYRSRKAEAERRLEKTHRNLDRVEDILSELGPRLKSLERQAVRAEKYDQVKADLRALLQEWYGYHWAKVQSELNQARDLEAKHRQELEIARRNQAAYDRDLSENQARVQSQRTRLNAWHKELAEHHSQKENISRDRAVAEERIRSLERQIQSLDTQRVRLEELLEAARGRQENTRQELLRVQSETQEYSRQETSARQALEEKKSQIESLEGQAESARTALQDFLQLQTRLRVQRSDRQEGLQEKKGALGALQQDLNEKQDRYTQLHQRYLDLKRELDLSAAKRESLEEELENLHRDQSEGRVIRERLLEQLSESRTEFSRLNAELLVLQQADQKLAGYAAGARTLLTAAREGELKGNLGTVSSFLDVPEEYETCITAALGDYLDAVILEEEGQPDQALELLLENASRGVLLPLNRLVVLDRPELDGNIPGLVGIAADLVSGPARYRPVIELLLGRVVVMKDRRDVQRVLRSQLPGLRAVTLRGEVFFPTGEIIAGNQGEAGLLSRSRQMKTWKDEIEEASRNISSLEENLARVDKQLSQFESRKATLQAEIIQSREAVQDSEISYREIALDHSSLEKELEWDQSRISTLQGEIQEDESQVLRLGGELEKVETDISLTRELVAQTSTSAGSYRLDEERGQLAHWEMQAAVSKQALENCQQRLAEHEIAWQEARDRLDQNTKQKEANQAQITSLRDETRFLEDGEKAILSEIDDLRGLINKTDQALTEDEKQQADLQLQEAEARKILNQAERAYAQADINLTRGREKLENIQERIREDIGLVELEYRKDISGPTPLPLDGYVGKLPVVTEISPDLGKTIREKRGQLRRLGAINPEAQEEYRDVSSRHEFLSEQLSDLRKAEADLKEVIAELDILMERDFRKTFNAVAGEFREIFTQLFGGGKGQLVLAEGDDLSGSGVDINVRLPGRRTQGLSLLSGGERSLIAAALIFSLLRISPTPFCVLDEVDAMLDESNVARFRKLVRELSSETQFIIITHNRNTVEVADIIYGIIMSEDSSSQVLSLKLDEVDEVIES